MRCSSSAWVSSCCCYRRTGISASSSSSQSCANVKSQQKATVRRALALGSTGEAEAGRPWPRLHIDSLTCDHANTDIRRLLFLFRSLSIPKTWIDWCTDIYQLGSFFPSKQSGILIKYCINFSNLIFHFFSAHLKNWGKQDALTNTNTFTNRSDPKTKA